jgi:succinate dehydrogenase / fumarate reductase cytochrome b subunit
MRALLALAVLAHAWLALGLTRAARHARPRDYLRQPLAQSAKAGRWMRSTGVLLAAWLGYHVAHMYGPTHDSYVPGDVHHNLVTGLASPLVALSYVVASSLLGVHLYHGVRSTLSTLGASARLRQRGELPARAFAAGITLILLAPPLCALGGYWSE